MEKNNSLGTYVSLGMCMGIIGGIIFENTIGIINIASGMCLGILGGSMLYYFRKRTKKDDDKSNEEDIPWI